MTAGHKHRTVKLEKTGKPYKILRRTILHKSTNLEKVEKSRFVYRESTFEPGVYELSLLGFLHPIIGLVVEIEVEDE